MLRHLSRLARTILGDPYYGYSQVANTIEGLLLSGMMQSLDGHIAGTPADF
jgi:hypothetical protein